MSLCTFKMKHANLIQADEFRLANSYGLFGPMVRERSQAQHAAYVR